MKQEKVNNLTKNSGFSVQVIFTSTSFWFLSCCGKNHKSKHVNRGAFFSANRELFESCDCDKAENKTYLSQAGQWRMAWAHIKRSTEADLWMKLGTCTHAHWAGFDRQPKIETTVHAGWRQKCCLPLSVSYTHTHLCSPSVTPPVFGRVRMWVIGGL